MLLYIVFVRVCSLKAVDALGDSNSASATVRPIREPMAKAWPHALKSR